MEKYVQNLINKLDLGLIDLEEKEQNVILFSKSAFNLCTSHLNDLRNFICTYNFSNEVEEIYFFKHLKPTIASKQILYNKMYKIESHCTRLPRKLKVEFYQNEIDKIQSFFEKKSTYFNYYKTENILSDQYYFRRKEIDINLHLEQDLFDLDTLFSTFFDIHFNKIRAFEVLLTYLENQIDNLENNNSTQLREIRKHLDWTTSKTDLVELMNALVAAKAINHGDVEMKKMADAFQELFQIDLGDFYRSFTELKSRSNPVKFLEKLIDALMFKIDNDLSL
ncbi:MAG: RteC domain-containing protein [Bacteroidota bacterium]